MAAVRFCSSLLPSPFFARLTVRKAAWRGDVLWESSACKTGLLHTGSMSTSYATSAPGGDMEGEFSLVEKKCVPCSFKELKPMTEEEARTLLSQIPEWELLDLDGKLQLQRSWKSKNFVKGLEFFKCIADVAELEGHHPDLHLVGWNNLTVNIFTHSVGGLTENDFILAAKISALDCKALLRRSVPKATPTAT